MKPREDNLYQNIGIYAIKNKINNKCYIGQTLHSLGDRRDSHFSLLRNGKHPLNSLQKDFAASGEKNFDFVVLHVLQDGEDIDELEKKYIAEYKRLGTCYNTLDGGRKGYKMVPLSDETRKHIGELNRQRMTGSKMSDESRKHMSESHKARFANMSGEERAAIGKKLGLANKNRQWTESQRQALREEQKIKPRGSKYTVEQVKEIRRLFQDEHYSIVDIAAKMDIPKPTVSNIVNYRRWKYV